MPKPAKASKPRPIGWGAATAMQEMAVGRYNRAEILPMYDTTGEVTKGRRVVNVFTQLSQGKSPPLTQNQAASGQRLIEIYAQWHRIAGKPDNADAGYVDGSRPAPELVTDRMIEAGKEYHAIMHYVGPSSARLLTALCEDWLRGDGGVPALNEAGVPIVRWRQVVAVNTGDTDPNRQSIYVKIAASDLNRYWNPNDE